MRQILLVVFFMTMAGCSVSGGVRNEEQSDGQIPIVNPPGDGATGEAVAIIESTEARAAPALSNLGMAPELTSEVWINSTEALRLADLRGKVVLLEMWTFG
jgi:hypothetical protein